MRIPWFQAVPAEEEAAKHEAMGDSAMEETDRVVVAENGTSAFASVATSVPSTADAWGLSSHVPSTTAEAPVAMDATPQVRRRSLVDSDHFAHTQEPLDAVLQADAIPSVTLLMGCQAAPPPRRNRRPSRHPPNLRRSRPL
jgi:hypothetical protein